ncbi:MAG: polyribonucleotide nucleotidyltransferase [Candidatus Dependentiae bacterium]|nr:polyribonucleotide nucleotidyltransferase [Candidatus Dependentiae bacterium]
MVKTFHLPEFGYKVELGKFAHQADGAVWIQQGGTIVLATVVSAESKEFPGFLPLTVEYREWLSAAGKIPGGYYKREGKPADREILTGRLIDRAMRPLFPHDYFNQVQVVISVYSVDKEHAPATLGMVAASLALTISKIPFLGPIGLVEGARVNGEWILCPTYPQTVASDARLTIAGTQEGVCMIEGSANDMSETDFIDVMFKAHEKIKEQVAWQNQIQKEVGVTKEQPGFAFDWNAWQDKIDAFLTPERVRSIYLADKIERNTALAALQETFIKENEEAVTAEELPTKVVDYIFDQKLQKKITELIFTLGKRVDGRSFDQIRPISTEVGLLPCTHGSALFNRGRTQALVSVTLGGGQDEQKIEGIMSDDSTDGNFMLHYNFPPFSVGEARPMRGPGRREIGHGYLAASALRSVLPGKEKFPYTIRIVADMLESDGSTSMATTCGSTMALMHAGVPIKKMVSGVAMGLLKSVDGKFIVLSDISGFEDAFGLMDFKVTGTDDGVTAIQMDIKYKGGFSREVFEAALAQAKKGRAHILGEMRKVMTEPNKELSSLVPKLVTVKVLPDKIGAIIGTGGKVIREITETTKTTIDIEPDGLVKIFGGPEADLNRAINWVKTLGGHIEAGTIYEGPIRKVAEFGLFVELVPGVDGLVHVSNIPKNKQRNFAQEYKAGDIVKVEVLEYDESNGRIRLRLAE